MSWKRYLAAFLSLGCLFFVYLLTFKSEIDSGDNLVQFYQTDQILSRQHVAFTKNEMDEYLADDAWEIRDRFILRSDGETYTQRYGIGQALLSLPLYAALKYTRDVFHLSRPTDITLWRLNAIFFAIICVFLVGLSGYLYGLKDPAVLTLCLFSAAFASPLWLYATMNFNNLTETMIVSLFIVLCGLLRGMNWGSRAFLLSLCASVLIGLGILVRQIFIILVPALYFLYSWSRLQPAATKKDIGTAHLVFLASLAFQAGAVLLMNDRYYGGYFKTGYEGLANFEGDWLAGFAGSWFVALKSPLYFFPLSVLLIFLIMRILLRKDFFSVFLALYLFPLAYLIPKYNVWFAGPEAYQRFWLNATPVIFLALQREASFLKGAKRKIFLSFFVIFMLLGLKAQVLTTFTKPSQVSKNTYPDYHASAGEQLRLDYDTPHSLLVTGNRMERRQIQDFLSSQVNYAVFRGFTSPWKRFLFSILFITLFISSTYVLIMHLLSNSHLRINRKPISGQ